MAMLYVHLPNKSYMDPMGIQIQSPDTQREVKFLTLTLPRLTKQQKPPKAYESQQNCCSLSPVPFFLWLKNTHHHFERCWSTHALNPKCWKITLQNLDHQGPYDSCNILILEQQQPGPHCWHLLPSTFVQSFSQLKIRKVDKVVDWKIRGSAPLDQQCSRLNSPWPFDMMDVGTRNHTHPEVRSHIFTKFLKTHRFIYLFCNGIIRMWKFA